MKKDLKPAIFISGVFLAFREWLKALDVVRIFQGFTDSKVATSVVGI